MGWGGGGGGGELVHDSVVHTVHSVFGATVWMLVSLHLLLPFF